MNKEKLVNYMFLSLTISILVQRISMAAGSIFLGLSSAFFLFLLLKKRDAFVMQPAYRPYFIMFVFFLISMIPSVLFTGNIFTGVKNIVGMWVYRSLPFFMVIIFASDTLKIKKMLFYWGGMLCLESTIAVIQLLFGLGDRGWGFGGSPLTLAGILCMLFPILMIIILDNRFEERMQRKTKIVTVFCFAGLLAALSRGAWLDLAIILPLLALPYLTKSREKAFYAFLLILFIGGIFATQPILLDKLKSITNLETNTSNLGRIYVWESAVKIINDHFGLGIGLGQFKNIYPYYRNPLEIQNVIHVHNSLLQVFVDTGVVGFLGCFSFFLFIIYYNVTDWLKYKNPYSLMITGVVYSLLLNGMTDNNFDNSALIKTFWFLLGCLLFLKKDWYEKTQKCNSKG